MTGCGEWGGAVEERAREKHRSFGLFFAIGATFHNIFRVVWRNPDFEGTRNIFGGSRSLHRHETRDASARIAMMARGGFAFHRQNRGRVAFHRLLRCGERILPAFAAVVRGRLWQ